MIVDDLVTCSRYAGLRGRFELAFRFLERVVATGEVPLDLVLAADEVWASVTTKPARAAQDAGFEYHEQCADVHMCLRGFEHMGWCENADGLQVRQSFLPERDFGVYAGTPERFVPLRGSRFVILFPGELHAPFIGEGEITKVCVKVRLPSFP
jgi:biofilm protein TabA